MEYKYVKVENDGGKMAIRFNTVFSGHRDIIDEHAKQGYKYVGYVPTEQSSHGVILSMDLVFAKG